MKDALHRRDFLHAVAAGLLTSRLSGAASADGPEVLTGDRFDLSIDWLSVNFTGRQVRATAVNGSVPGPILRWREGETVTLAVHNCLPVPTSIHWHGVRVPAGMDGVPGLSFRGIDPGETFVYRIPVKQGGTYWYHSHSHFQEQTGVVGALVIEPLLVRARPSGRLPDNRGPKRGSARTATNYGSNPKAT